MSIAYRILVGLLLTSSSAFSADLGLGQGRLFLGSAQVSPSELNTELTAQGIKNVDLNNQFGIEITFPTFEYLQLGLRYSHHLLSQDASTSGNDYKASLTQDSMMGVARIPLVKSDVVRFDLFAGVGASKSSYTIKSASQDGKLEKDVSPIAAAGASVAVGYKKFFLFFEGGYESNKLDDLSSSGTINTNVKSIDLSGSYLLMGLMFDGIPIFSK
ncbi:hypothetical protein ACLVWU_06295 [Bdellovibrio sp. HCB290]|uniref:hypothetical protein n=1 Tax=Bdellovibrio sp. HCB290 TaxID=3394356 RepID=UPI0039B54F66